MRVVVFAAVVVFAGAAQAQSAPVKAGDVFKELAGSCWRTQLDLTSTDTDTHCFHTAVGGQMVTDTNTVRSKDGKVQYEGVSIYQFDKASGMLRYDYYNAPGDHFVGYAVRTGAEIAFRDDPKKDPTLVWKLRPDGYDVVPAPKSQAHPGKFIKVGPSN